LCATVNDEITQLVVETLEEGLSRLRRRPVRIREMQRDLSSRSSSFRTERLRVITNDDAPPLSIYFKDLHPEHQVTQSWALRRADRTPSPRELQMYECVLSPQRFGTLEFYGGRWEPECGRCWLFIEDVGYRMLQGEKDVGAWADACRWAARFHVATRNLPAARTAFLPVYDEKYYRDCAERVERMLRQLDAADGDLVRRGLAYVSERIELLSTLPRCVIHGQFFGKNIMLRPMPADHPLAVIDWETAALGPGFFDLASISSGKWTAEQRLAMWRAYVDQYQVETNQPLEWEQFLREFVATAAFHALDWLVFWSQHPEPSRRFPKFLRELDALLHGRHLLAAIDQTVREGARA
jgi:hypothetical protein